MKEFKVTITETYRKTVTVMAEEAWEASETVEEKWNGGKYIIDNQCFVGADFVVSEES